MYLAKYEPLRGETYILTPKKASKRKTKKPAWTQETETTSAWSGLFPPLVYDVQHQKEKPNEAGRLPKNGIYSARARISYIIAQLRNFLWCKP